MPSFKFQQYVPVVILGLAINHMHLLMTVDDMLSVEQVLERSSSWMGEGYS